MFLLFLQRLVSKNALIVGLTLALFWLALLWHQATTHLKEVQSVYQNPEVKTVEKIVQVAGPVQTIVKIVERSTGEKETTITRTQAPSSTVTEMSTEKAPVAIANTMTPYRTDRYLLTFGVNSLTEDFRGKAILAGYGFKNRFDLQAGIVRTDRSTGWVLATIRF